MDGQQLEKKRTGKLEIQWPITIVSVGLLFVAVMFLALKPGATVNTIDTIFQATMSGAGPFLLLFDAALVVICFFIAISKYGKIKLGEGKPEYSMFSYIAMMACAALASASMFWSFTEWAYYNITPGLGLKAGTEEAMNISMGYSFFHWGFLAQCVYVAIGLITAYALYARKLGTVKMSLIAEDMMRNFKGRKIIGRFIDVIVIFCTLGGLGVSLGLGIPVISGGIQRVTGMEVSFGMRVVIVLVLFVVFSWSSFVGTGKGMKFLSNNTVKLLGVFIAFIFIFGPTSFIQKLFVSSLGYMAEYFPRMATFTDPIGNSGFAENWTIFFIAFPMTYAGLMGVFVAKISKGRSVRSLVLACMFGISVGTWVFFAVNGGLAMNREISGEYSIINAIKNGDPYAGVYHLLDTLPLGVVLAVIYIVCVAGFICTTMDTASLCLASTTIKKLDEHNDPSKKSRMFWCVMLTLLPLALMFSGADFDAMKSLAILVSTPLAVVLLFMMIGLFRWMREDRRTPGKLKYEKNDFVDYDK
ncbi:MAG: BCCT family transporter [Eubacteriaceae bacterium]|nr:BCCT family transporter [Eubacteriaceae bacterium]